MKLVKNSEEKKKINIRSMEVGQVAIPDEKYPDLEGRYMLRTFGGWVDLENPRKTWDEETSFNVAPILVTLLPPNTELTFRVNTDD